MFRYLYNTNCANTTNYTKNIYKNEKNDKKVLQNVYKYGILKKEKNKEKNKQNKRGVRI